MHDEVYLRCMGKCVCVPVRYVRHRSDPGRTVALPGLPAGQRHRLLRQLRRLVRSVRFIRTTTCPSAYTHTHSHTLQHRVILNTKHITTEELNVTPADTQHLKTDKDDDIFFIMLSYNCLFHTLFSI